MNEIIRKIIDSGNLIGEIAEKLSGEQCVKEFGMNNEKCHEDADCNDCWIECLEKIISE